ncbi:MAG: phosphoribosylamine--glycine ligase [Herpetosiphonaceae bacterium]|nr:MAG: phosphoribosylamine--glycine ligase [Herpetosiphonaceae bacterium]
MKILVLGDRGKAHAIVWKLFNSSHPIEMVCAPGNGGTAQLVPSAVPPIRSTAEICHWALAEGFSLIIPAEPIYLQVGLADEAAAFRLPVFGAPQRAAQLEQSRLWAKDFLLRHGIPTPDGRPFSDLRTAEKYLAGHQPPVVLRGDLPLEPEGIYGDRYSAMRALEQMFAAPLPPGHLRGAIVEAYTPGPRVAFSAISDGEHVLPLLPVRLYDRLGAGEQGRHAPAMGAHISNSQLVPALARQLFQRLIQPLVEAMHREGVRIRGLLGIDCILAADGPLVTDIRCSWSALEAQVLLPRLAGDLLPIIEAALSGRLAALPPLRWNPQASVALGLVMEGYPDQGGDGIVVSGLADIDPGTLVFHSQTTTPYGLRYIPSATTANKPDIIETIASSLTEALGGRSPAAPGDILSSISTTGREVLAIVALGATLPEARARAYANASRIHFQGRTFRPDIAEREL